TQEASLMISALGEALRQRDPALPRVEFRLAPERIATAEQAARLGRACGAMIVLWEPGQTKTLALTLPQPAQVPLRDLVQERLCEFGNHNEQLNILYLTIAGLLSMRENEYDKAVLYMESARTIDNHCLHLPGSGPAGAAPSPGSLPRSTVPPRPCCRPCCWRWGRAACSPRPTSRWGKPADTRSRGCRSGCTACPSAATGPRRKRTCWTSCTCAARS
ncbi:MAG TPA: hypothetical protein VGC20_07205, partial [bacterium]